jgi:hypothetical protein
LLTPKRRGEVVKIERVHAKWGENPTILHFVQLFAGHLPRALSIYASIDTVLAAFGLSSTDIGYAVWLGGFWPANIEVTDRFFGVCEY